jgi:hypothetical protein
MNTTSVNILVLACAVSLSIFTYLCYIVELELLAYRRYIEDDCLFLLF